MKEATKIMTMKMRNKPKVHFMIYLGHREITSPGNLNLANALYDCLITCIFCSVMDG